MSDLLELIPQKRKLLCQVPVVQFDKVLDMIKEHHTVVIPAFYKRFDEQFQCAKEEIETSDGTSEETSCIKSIKIDMQYEGNPVIDNIQECLEIEMVHDFDLLNYLISGINATITIKKAELVNSVVTVAGEIFSKKFGNDISFEIVYTRVKSGMGKQYVYIDENRYGYAFEITQNDASGYWKCYNHAYKEMCKEFDAIPVDSCDGEMRIQPFIRTMDMLNQAVDLAYDDSFIEAYNAKNQSTLPIDKHIYKPFLGTTSILCSKDGLLKAIKSPMEIQVFKYLSQTELKKFIPEYHGKVNINDTKFISMSDLTANYSVPKVLDVKMGQTSSINKMAQQPYGFKCIGTVSEPNKLCYTWEDLISAVKRYLKDNKENYCRYEVLPYLVTLLKEFYKIVSSIKGVQFKQVSLMLIFDCLDNGRQKPLIQLVDFSKCILDETNEDVDHYFLFGIQSLIKLLTTVHEYYTNRDVVFLCRHGYRLDYSDLNWVPTAKYPHDPPLSPEGKQQAKDLAERMKYENIDLIVSSPFYRATQTAQIIATELGIKYAVEPAFGEYLSIRNRKAVPDLDPTSFNEDPQLDRSFTPSSVELSLETWHSMQDRVHAALNTLTKTYRRIAIVSHRSTFQALLSVIVGKQFKYPLEFASITSLIPSKRQTGFVIDRINMFSHLTVFTESPYYNPNYAAKNYTDMIINENGDVMDS